MKIARRFPLLRLSFIALAGCVLFYASPLLGVDSLTWRARQNKVEARIESWELPKLLQQIAAATGWQVYLEPGTQRRIAAKFKDLSPGDALRHLLGDLNFALLPQANAPSKLFVFQNSLQDATQQILPPADRDKTGKAIANELIVTLKPDAKESIDELAKRLHAKVTGRADGLKAYRLQFEDEAATQSARDELAGDSEVSSVDANFPIENPTRLDGLSLSSEPSFALKPPLNGDKSRVIVGLVDTSVQPQATGFGEYFLQGLQVAGDSGPTVDSPTHGTAMAETILHGVSLAQKEGLGQNVRILPVDVYGPNATTSTFDVAGGIAAAVNAGATVINLSLGSEGDTPFLQRLIQQAHGQGILFVGAAGNDPVTAPFYPAAYPEVIAVTAGDKKGNIAAYANRGDFVDAVAPGTSVINFADQSYLVSGTSAAAAYVSGLAAGLASGASKPISEIEAQVRRGMAVTPPVKTLPKP